MISILIPTYNYPVSPLIGALKTQLSHISVSYEVICFEDGSSKYIPENSAAVNSIANAEHIISNENKGRITTRQALAKMAKFDWLLFLDSDVIIEQANFINAYLQFLNLDYDAIYGGYNYDLIKPEQSFVLRWTYGTNYEHVDADKRNKTPYKIVISGNFLIKKSTFLEINSKIESDGYGYDNYFGALLKSHHIKVFHINNTVIHKGLDTNAVFLNKTEKAVATVHEIYKNHPALITENSLLEFYKSIRSYGLARVIVFLFKIFKSSLRKQLLGSKPNLKLLQFYKLGYLCALMSSTK